MMVALNGATRRGMGAPRTMTVGGGTMMVPLNGKFGQPRAGWLGTVVGAFKSAVTRRINQHRGAP
jgi:hypothetical protein